MFLGEKLQRTIENLSMIEDPHERLATLVDRAKRIAPLAPGDRTEANRVHGCVSVVWLVGEIREGRCYFRGDAESPVVRGLLVFVSEFFSDAPIHEVAASDLDPLDSLGVARNLSPTRRNGLAAARTAIRDFAAKRLSARPSS